MLLRISAYLCVHPTQNPLTGSNEAPQSFIGAVLNGGVPLCCSCPRLSMDLDRASERNQAGGRIEPLSCLANRFLKKSKARLLVLSEKLQFPCIGHTRGTTMLEKQIDQIR